MKGQIILTISVAACNVEKYIGACMRSLMDYRFLGRLEVLIIDDGGTDGTMSIARTMDQRMPGIFKLVHKRNEGWGSTINYSIQHAQGKYFRILDGDDLMNTEALERELQVLEETEVDLVYTPHVEFHDGDGSLAETGITDTVYRRSGLRYCGWQNPMPEEGTYALADVADHLALCMHNCTFRTSILRQEVRIPEKCFYTDNNYMFMALHHCSSVHLLHQYVYCYRKGRDGQSTSRDGHRRYAEDHTRMILDVTRYMEDCGAVRRRIEIDRTVPLSSKIDQILVRNLSGMIMGHYGLRLFLGPDRVNRKELRDFDRLIRHAHPELIRMRWKCCVLAVMLKFPGYYVTSVLFHFYNFFRALY